MVGPWHEQWQLLLSSKGLAKEEPFPREPAGIKNRRGDAVAHLPGRTLVIEVQHSVITKAEVEARRHDYVDCHGTELIWVIDGSAPCRVHTLAANGTALLVFDDASAWKYDRFTGHAHVYMDCGGMIYRMRPGAVRSHMVHVPHGVPKAAFVDALCAGTHDALWPTEDPRQCTLYFNQRGAGCGKTYEAVQLLAGRDARFQHVRTFVYLTKVHSAKSVIYDEFRQQMGAGLLDVAIEAQDDMIEGRRVGKQYRVEFTRDTDGARIQVVIGTIDSFMYALGDVRNAGRQGGDFFRELRKSIIAGHKAYGRGGDVAYGGEKLTLDRECLVLVDEAQDLERSYVESLAAIMLSTSIDVYMIGDILQSIWSKDNVFTYLWDAAHELPGTHVEFSTGDNIVRRFHNAHFIAFVNAIVPFAKFGLPEVTGICPDGDACKYAPHASACPFRVFTQPKITPRTKDTVLEDFVQRGIIDKVRREVDAHGLLPEHFMFIFPFMDSNVLAYALETALDEFWIARFDDPQYQADVLAKDPYWGARIGDGRFYRHAVLHRSEESQPINLDTSVRATRLLTIHAAKGQGREVVFLLNVSEDALARFSGGERDLVYESLLHVAVTRQKLRLYVGLPKEDDDIRRRFEGAGASVDDSDHYAFCGDSTRVGEVAQYLQSNDAWSQRLHASCFAPRGLIEAVLAPEATSTTVPPGQPVRDIIEWGHHVVRAHVMRYMLIANIVNEGDGDWCQVLKVMDVIAKARVQPLVRASYYAELARIETLVREKIVAPDVVPILRFDSKRPDSKYHVYSDVLRDYVKHVQAKLRDSLKRRQLPALCPLEACVLVHVMDVTHHGRYAPFQIMELYDLLHSMDTTDLPPHDDHYHCLCGERLGGGAHAADSDTALRLCDSVTQHYAVLDAIRTMFRGFERHLREEVGDTSPIKYNIDHTITYRGRSESSKFKLFTSSVPVVATTKHTAVLFAMHPTLDQLNCRDVFTQALLNTYVARNDDGKANTERFMGKRVLVCVFTFTHALPVWLDLDRREDGDDDALVREGIQAALTHRYTRTNACLWTLYARLREEHAPDIGAALKQMIRRLDVYHAPTYARNLFAKAEEAWQDEDDEYVTSNATIQRWFDRKLMQWLA